MDRVVISCKQLDELPPILALANSHSIGLELQEFSNVPDLLDGEWREQVKRYRRVMGSFAGELAIHGSFMDMFPGSPDRRVAALARERFHTNLLIAAELGAGIANFHVNYMPQIDDPAYLPGWIERQIAFWRSMATEAEPLGVRMVLENMWEPDPALIERIVKAVDSPFVRSCIDVGHAQLYSTLPLAEWIAALQPYLTYVHLHNTDGQKDNHLPFDTGVLDMHHVLNQLRALPHPPIFCMELPALADIEASLPFLNLNSARQSAP